MASSNSAKAPMMISSLDENRQLGGMFFCFSVCCVMHFRMASLAGAINGNGKTANDGVDLFNLIGWVCALTIGTAGVIVGFVVLMQRYNPQNCTPCFLTPGADGLDFFYFGYC